MALLANANFKRDRPFTSADFLPAEPKAPESLTPQTQTLEQKMALVGFIMRHARDLFRQRKKVEPDGR